MSDHAAAVEVEGEGGGRRAGGREPAARRRRGAAVRMGRSRGAGWAVLILAAISGLKHAESYQETGYACGRDTSALSDAGREGTHLDFNAQSRLLHTTRNATLYGSTFTVQLLAKLTDDRAFTPGSEVTLIGNSDSDGGRNTGWKVSCSQGVCCLKGYLKQIKEREQMVCTHNEQGAPILQNQWFHITARYEAGGRDVNGARGKAAIFVNGLKHNEVEWGNPGRGAINYEQPYPPFAVGSDSSPSASAPFFRGKMDEVRLWTKALTDEQILDTSFETAWRKRGVDGSCFPETSDNREIYTRIASVTNLSPLALYIKDPTNARRSNLNAFGEPWINASSTTGISYPGVGAEGGYLEKAPVLEVLPTSRGVLADVFPRLGTAGAASYNSSVPDDVTVVVSQHEVTVLELRVRDPNYDDVVSVRKPLRFMDRLLLDSDLDCMREGLGTEELEKCNVFAGKGDGMGWMSFAGVDGYEGMHAEGSNVMNSIITDENFNLIQILDADNRLVRSNDPIKGTPEDPLTQCRQDNSEAQGMPEFLPPYTDVQSRLHVRVVWSHDTNFHWWLPEQGFEYDMVVRSYSRYRKSRNEAPAEATPAYRDACIYSGGDPIEDDRFAGECTRLKLGLHAHFSPEFVNSGTYPKPSQQRPDDDVSDFTHWNAHEDSLKGVKHGDTLAVAVGEELEVMVRVFDRNQGDANVIKAREDPGLPPGHVITTLDGAPVRFADTVQAAAPGDVLATHSRAAPRSQLMFPPSYATPQVDEGDGMCPTCSDCGAVGQPACASEQECSRADTCVYNCGDRYRNSDGTDLSPPDYVDRLFTYRPREQNAGALFRVCLYAETQHAPRMGLKRYDARSRITEDLCFSIRVLVPAPTLELPPSDRVFEALVGCQLMIPVNLRDGSSSMGYALGNGKEVLSYPNPSLRAAASPDTHTHTPAPAPLRPPP